MRIIIKALEMASNVMFAISYIALPFLGAAVWLDDLAGGLYLKHSSPFRKTK
jgi:hypothetical protein